MSFSLEDILQEFVEAAELPALSSGRLHAHWDDPVRHQRTPPAGARGRVPESVRHQRTARSEELRRRQEERLARKQEIAAQVEAEKAARAVAVAAAAVARNRVRHLAVTARLVRMQEAEQRRCLAIEARESAAVSAAAARISASVSMSNDPELATFRRVSLAPKRRCAA